MNDNITYSLVKDIVSSLEVTKHYYSKHGLRGVWYSENEITIVIIDDNILYEYTYNVDSECVSINIGDKNYHNVEVTECDKFLLDSLYNLLKSKV